MYEYIEVAIVLQINIWDSHKRKDHAAITNNPPTRAGGKIWIPCRVFKLFFRLKVIHRASEDINISTHALILRVWIKLDLYWFFFYMKTLSVAEAHADIT